MASGIATREDGVIDGRFYFHLGDALTRLGRSEEARQVIGTLYSFPPPWIPFIPFILELLLVILFCQIARRKS